MKIDLMYIGSRKISLCKLTKYNIYTFSVQIICSGYCQKYRKVRLYIDPEFLSPRLKKSLKKLDLPLLFICDSER